jgi:hypothetical protein
MGNVQTLSLNGDVDSQGPVSHFADCPNLVEILLIYT